MKTIETDITITLDGQLLLELPLGVAPGHYKAVLVLDNQPVAPAAPPPFDWPTIDPGMWPDNLPLRREDMYGDDGR